MKDIIVRKNIPYLVVKPVKSLFHSSMIVDVVNSGRKFAVNLLTNELTIIDLIEKPQCYYMRDNHTFRHFNENLKEIVTGIREELIEGYTHGTFFYHSSSSNLTIGLTKTTMEEDLKAVINGLKGIGIK